jgi:hypothetical protein
MLFRETKIKRSSKENLMRDCVLFISAIASLALGLLDTFAQQPRNHPLHKAEQILRDISISSRFEFSVKYLTNAPDHVGTI